MESVRTPNRSDIHLSKEEELKIEEETRDYFDKAAPKHHTKPQRSEYSSEYVDALACNEDDNNSAKLRHLQNDPQKLVYNAREATEEFVETEYYKDLNCVDKQHHTTGTGFINVENGKCFCLALDTNTTCRGSCKVNPATNDWIPSPNDTATVSSDKPNRSDN